MKILHLTTFTSGGAGIACMRLHRELRKNGFNSKVLAFDTHLHNGQDIYDYKQLINTPSLNKLIFRFDQSMQWRHQNDLLKGKSKEYDFFSLPYVFNNIRHLKIFKEADIIHLHWVANFINYEELPLFNKKIIWTIHDMNPITGGCHYSYDCKKFFNECSSCPQLSGTKNNNIVADVFSLKKRDCAAADITYIAPSKWMLQQIKSSKISFTHESRHIPYGLDLNVFKPLNKTEARKQLNLPLSAKIILYVSDNLENRRKGFHYINKISSESLSEDILFCCIGMNNQNISMNKINYLGYFEDENQLATIYSAADLFIIPSVEDNLPNTVLESMACGLPVIGFNSGGIPEMVDDGKNGFLIERDDIASMKNKISEIIYNTELLTTLSKNARQKAVEKFDSSIQGSKYTELYESTKKIKVLHINTFDNIGGASQVAYDLVHNTNEVDSTLLVAKKKSKSNKVIQFSPKILDDVILAIDKVLWKLGYKNSVKNLLGISDELNFTHSKLKKLKEYRDADIIHLHNIHGNYFDLSALKKIAAEKYIVWTLHDMWALTGGEAHTFGNENYKIGIGKTPYNYIYPLKNPLFDKRQQFLELKKEIYAEFADKITFVPVSKWLENCLISSYVYNKEAKFELNYNGVNTDIFHNYRRRSWVKPRLLFFNIDSPFKGSQIFLDIVNRIKGDYDLIVVGEPLKLSIPYKHIQYISEREYLNEIYNDVDFLIFPSLAESFGLTILEALACGVCVIASDIGGIPEVLDNSSGYLFRSGDSEDLLDKIHHALNHFSESRYKADVASGTIQKFSLEKSSSYYLSLYNQILGHESYATESKNNNKKNTLKDDSVYIEH